MITIHEHSEREAYVYRHNPFAARWSVGEPGRIHVADDAQAAAVMASCPACADANVRVVRVAAATLTYHCAACREEWTVLRNRRPAVAPR